MKIVYIFCVLLLGIACDRQSNQTHTKETIKPFEGYVYQTPSTRNGNTEPIFISTIDSAVINGYFIQSVLVDSVLFFKNYRPLPQMQRYDDVLVDDVEWEVNNLKESPLPVVRKGKKLILKSISLDTLVFEDSMKVGADVDPYYGSIRVRYLGFDQKHSMHYAVSVPYEGKWMHVVSADLKKVLFGRHIFFSPSGKCFLMALYHGSHQSSGLGFFTLEDYDSTAKPFLAINDLPPPDYLHWKGENEIWMCWNWGRKWCYKITFVKN